MEDLIDQDVIVAFLQSGADNCGDDWSACYLEHLVQTIWELPVSQHK